jgi:chromosomal replication initiator protein
MGNSRTLSSGEEFMRAEQIWQAALGELQLQMTKATFDTWVKNTSLISCEDGTFVVAVQNGFAKEWLENRLLTIIKRTLTGIVGHAVEVKFVVQSRGREKTEQTALLDAPRSEPPRQPAARSSNEHHLNPKYKFQNFIVGSSNRLAHAAALAVAENPAHAYNPFFLYGGVGLGKTHLLHAVGHHLLAKGARVLYVSSEEFTNDLINSIRKSMTDAFREKYRTIDVLLIDDIQFIAGKESTQEEFFHTFNTLHSADKQIVISSDRPPKAILTLEERLRSRFEWGLLVDIQPPDLETRIAILQNKAEMQAAQVPYDVLEFVAQRIQSNIRELEGALNKVLALARLTSTSLTVSLAEKALQDIVTPKCTKNPEQILNIVADFYGLGVEDLIGSNRSKRLVKPRQIAMYLIREETDSSLPQIGALLGGRDHTTIIHGCEKIACYIEEDDQIRREIISLREMLHNGRHG